MAVIVAPGINQRRKKMKTLSNTDTNTTQSNVKDVVFFGDDLFKLLSKASSESEGWMKSTKAMEVDGGCVVQVTTQQRNPDGTYAIAEAITFVPGVKISINYFPCGDGEKKKIHGRRLAPA